VLFGAENQILALDLVLPSVLRVQDGVGLAIGIRGALGVNAS